MSEFVGTGRHLSATEMRLWTSFVDLSRILETELEAQLLTNFAMTHREYEILVRIDGAGGQMRMSELARRVEASPALISQTVNRLVERGWLEREPAPGDRRGVQATLTADGYESLAQAARPHAELVRELLISPIDEGDLKSTAEAIGAAADHLRAHRSGEPCEIQDCPVRN